MSSSNAPRPRPPRRRRVGYRLQPPTTSTSPVTDDEAVLWLVEDPTLVLLGGEVWPSAFAMAEAVEARLQCIDQPPPSVVVELGAGAGLCGLVAAAVLQQQHVRRPCRVFLTDESPELAAVNAELFGPAASSDVTVEALELLWGDAIPPPLATALSSPRSLLVLGCEVTPMAKTQPALVATLRALLLDVQDDATALLTVDACTLQEAGPSSTMEYPRVCPAAAEEGRSPCAGHRFLGLVEAGGDMEWAVERVWIAEEARAACRARRVREEGDGGGVDEGRVEGVDFGAATAPEGLVLVSVTRQK